MPPSAITLLPLGESTSGADLLDVEAGASMRVPLHMHVSRIALANPGRAKLFLRQRDAIVSGHGISALLDVVPLGRDSRV